MPNDPFGSGDPFQTSLAGGVRGGRRRAQFQPLPDEQAEPLKDSLINKGVSGLTWVGQTLDKAFGARAIRGVLAGDNREALSAIPFSDTLGLTDPTKSHSMDEVLQRHGIVGKNDPDRWEARDFLVPAAEILADPGTYLSFGSSALTKAGQAARNLGVLPKAHAAALAGFDATEAGLKAAGRGAEEIAHLGRSGQRIAPEALAGAKANEPLAGLFGLGLPFSDPVVTFGHGKTSQAIAGAFDSAKDAVKYAPGVRYVRGLLDPNAGRSFDAVPQRAAEQALRPNQQRILAETRQLEHESRYALDPITRGPSVPAGAELEAHRLIRQSAEGISQAGDRAAWQADLVRRHGLGQTPGIADPNAVAAHIGQHFDTLTGIGQRYGAVNKAWQAEAERLGLPVTNLADEHADYLARIYAGLPDSKAGSGQTVFNNGSPSNIHRADVLRGIPGATEQINSWAMDKRLSGAARTFTPDQVAKEIHGDMIRQLGPAAATLTPEAAEELVKKANGMAEWLGGINPIHAQGTPVFNPDTVAAMVTRGQRQANMIGAGAASFHGIADAARPIAELAGTDHVPVLQLLNNLGLVTRQSPTGQWDGAAARLYEQMAHKGAAFGDFANGFNPTSFLEGHAVSRADADAMTRFLNGWTKPHELGPAIKYLDSATNLFKSLAYPAWPAAHVRNLTSAVYNNWIHGTPWASYGDAAKVLKGQGLDAIPELARLHPNWATMTPQQRSDLVHQLAYAHSAVFQGNGANEVIGRNLGLEGLQQKLANGEQFSPPRPGDHSYLFGPEGVAATAREQGKQAFNPLAVSGVGGRTTDAFAPVLAGRRVGTQVEDFARLASFIGGLRKGMTPEVAGQLTRKVHFDYQDLTKFEQEVMRRVVPFYTFSRKNLPLQLDMLTRHPGQTTTALHALTNEESPQSFTPEYLSSGVAIPMGQTTGADGQEYTRYLNRVGLPFEEALERLKFQNVETPWGGTASLPNVGATAMSYLGSTNPYLKAPLESITNTQFHTQRKLSDLRSEGLWGGYGVLPQEVAQPLTQIMANSPLARVGTTADKLADDRKGLGPKALNLLTGVGVTDVNVDRLHDIEARKAAEQVLAKDPNIRSFTNLYVRPGHAQELSPETVELMRLYSGMKQEATANAEAARLRERQEKLKQMFGGGF